MPSEQRWMLNVWMFLLVLMHQVHCFLPAPQNVSIVSFNLEHRLIWTSGPGSSAPTRFRVQSYSHGGRSKLWVSILNCTDLRAGESCDLTDSFKDIYCHYSARVQAFSPGQESNWTSSKMFSPLQDTTLGSPVVELTGCGNCLVLQLSPPFSRGLHRKHLKYLFQDFTVNVSRTRDKAQFVIRASSGENRITYLEQGVEYCLMVLPVTILNKHVVPSGPYCAYTSPAPLSSEAVLVTAVCIVLLFVVLCCAALIYSGQFGDLRELCL